MAMVPHTAMGPRALALSHHSRVAGPTKIPIQENKLERGLPGLWITDN